MKIVNIGIIAHVDAGKTSLTERLLFHAGVISDVGSVDRGDTQTDSMDLERRRGITIRSAVVALRLDDVAVNIIDTPGHPDFIAEVERALRVLDAAVLVISAVEGVQPQTRILMRTLGRLRVPVLIFVNKIDRAGARPETVFADIRRALAPGAVAMGTVVDAGTAAARFVPHDPGDEGFLREVGDLLADRSDAFLTAYLDDRNPLGADAHRAELVRQTGRGLVHPVFFGSAVTGAGVAELVGGVRDLLPMGNTEEDGDLKAVVFKIERGGAGERIAYVRLYQGTLDPRQTVPVRRQDGTALVHPVKVSAVRVFDRGVATAERPARAGEIAQVLGLRAVRIGDRLGAEETAGGSAHLPRPDLEAVVRPHRSEDVPALYAALHLLAEQDPLIDVSRDDVSGDLTVRLYGEVQKEFLAATLAESYGIGVSFAESQTIYVERLVGDGAAMEDADDSANPYCATVGLRVEPAPPGSGVTFTVAVQLGILPAAFHRAIEATVRRTLRQGLYGWEIVDCAVTLTHTGYVSPHSVAGDFRNLTPLVLMAAVKKAGTRVYEPINRFELEFPVDTSGAVFTALAEVAAVPGHTLTAEGVCRVVGWIPARQVHGFRERLPGLTQGEGVLLAEFDGYRRLDGRPPTRSRTDHNPLHRAEYLARTPRWGM